MFLIFTVFTNRVSRTDPNPVEKTRKNTTGESELMNNHCKHVITSLLIVPKCPRVVSHPKCYVLGFYSFLLQNVSQSCPYFHENHLFWVILNENSLSHFENRCPLFCRYLLFAEKRDQFNFFLTSRYIVPLLLKTRKKWFARFFKSPWKNMWQVWG